MKKWIPTLLISLIGVVPAPAQYLSSFQLIRTFNFTQIDSLYTANGIPTFFFPKRFNVEVYKVTYNTVSFDSSVTTATGALLLPVNPPCKLPLISYQHGTETVKTNVPSYLGGELPVGVVMASDGYAASLPDYLGLGDSPLLIHPYLHSQSEASATIDMLRAARELIDSVGLELNGQLFLAGYSQGGHATMATQRVMEERFPAEFPITASLPMSGPYDLSGSQARVIEVDSVFSASVYLPYIVFAYDEVYNLWAEDSSVFISPYDSSLRPLFNGQNNLLTINSQLPVIPNDILQPLLLDSFINDSNHYVRQALRANDLTDWTPVSPTKIMYCTADEQVLYQNSVVAYNKFIQNGSTSVQLIDAGPFTHANCASNTFINGKAWFDSLRTDKLLADIQVINESFSGAQDGQITVNVIGGQPPVSLIWSNGVTTTINGGLTAGTYIVTITDSVGCARTDTVEVGVTSSLISFSGSNGIFRCYPNPATAQITLQSDRNTGSAAEVFIYDLSGRTIYSGLLQRELLINCSEWMKGLYIIKVVSESGLTSVGKIVVE